MLDFMLRFCAISSLLCQQTLRTLTRTRKRLIRITKKLICRLDCLRVQNWLQRRSILNSNGEGNVCSCLSEASNMPLSDGAINVGRAVKTHHTFLNLCLDVGVEVGKVSLSRAQRKRLKLKKVKETVPDAVPAKKLIGPLLPDVLEKGRHGLDELESVVGLLQEDDTAQKCLTPTNTGDGQDVHDVGEHESLSIGTEDENCMRNAGELESLCTNTEEGDVYDGAVGTENEKHMHNAGELKSLCTNTGQGKDVHEGDECEFLSRTKRRRLAKKNFQNNFPRCPVAGSSFTAEKRGEDIIIKQIL